MVQPPPGMVEEQLSCGPYLPSSCIVGMLVTMAAAGAGGPCSERASPVAGGWTHNMWSDRGRGWIAVGTSQRRRIL